MFFTIQNFQEFLNVVNVMTGSSTFNRLGVIGLWKNYSKLNPTFFKQICCNILINYEIFMSFDTKNVLIFPNIVYFIIRSSYSDIAKTTF